MMDFELIRDFMPGVDICKFQVYKRFPKVSFRDISFATETTVPSKSSYKAFAVIFVHQQCNKQNFVETDQATAELFLLETVRGACMMDNGLYITSFLRLLRQLLRQVKC